MSNETLIPPGAFTNQCSVPGQADIYGVGIRVSLYVQWFSTVLAYLYEPKSATQCTVVNYFFSIAVGICALVHRGEIKEHEVIIVAMLLMLPPTIVVVILLDHMIWLFKKDANDAKSGPDKTNVPPTSPAITMPPPCDTDDQITPVAGCEDPSPLELTAEQIDANKRYGPWKWVRDFAAVIATSFLLSVAVWEFFDGVDKAERIPGCEPKFIWSHYLSGRYEMLLKVVSIMFAVFAPMVLIVLILMRMIAGMDYLHRSEEETKDAEATTARPNPTSRRSLARSESLYSLTLPLRSSKCVAGPLNVRSLVAIVWGAIASFVIAKIETIIKQNQILDLQDPSEAGQLIPLIIGVCQFCVITYKYWIDPKHPKNWRRKQRPQNPKLKYGPEEKTGENKEYYAQ